MKKIFLVVLLILASSTALGGYEWKSYGGKEYALTLGTGDWDQMEAEAEAVGGYLVTINDADESNWLASEFNQKLPQPEGDYLWMGFYQDHDDPYYSEPAGGWKWISGEPVNWLGWAPPLEPTNSPPGEDYGTLGGTGEWNDWGPERPDFYPIHGIIEIPEPATLFLLGLGGLALRRKRRQNSFE